jgi:hypothetical protein
MRPIPWGTGWSSSNVSHSEISLFVCTTSNIAAAATQPVAAQVIDATGYAAAFGITALFPVAAAFAIPVTAAAAGAVAPGRTRALRT